MILLLVAGFGLLVTGLTAIAFGIPVKEFSFGNTLILCGTIVASTGALMLGMRAAVGALRATVLGAPAATATAPQSNIPARRLPPLEPPAPDRAPDEGETFLFSRDRPSTGRPDSSASASSPARTTERAETDRSAASAESGSPPPWRDEIARDRGRTRSAPPPRSAEPESEPEPEPEPEPAAESEASAPSESTQKQRRNLLFASSRRERERAARAAQAGEAAAAGLPELPLLANEPRRTTFEEAWPETERARPEPLRARLFPGAEAHDPTAASEPAAPAAGAPDEAPQVTVLKSGVVDGMAYSLYSDGSIEAEMPEGKMHFASIDELRSHLDQRS